MCLKSVYIFLTKMPQLTKIQLLSNNTPDGGSLLRGVQPNPSIDPVYLKHHSATSVSDGIICVQNKLGVCCMVMPDTCSGV